MKPLAIDLYCGLGGFTEGLLAEGYEVIGFDIEKHDYGTGKYPGHLVIQDVLTLHGRQFRNASLIVASPPCQEFSYMAMPWSRAKQIEAALLGKGDFPEGYTGSRTRRELTALFDACFRIQREASEAAGRHIPMVVENVRGAQKWVGRAQCHYGSYYLWGDVPALMPLNKITKGTKPFTDRGWTQGCAVTLGLERYNGVKGIPHAPAGHWTNPNENGSMAKYASRSNARKEASAMIAKIPYPLARHIAKVYKPS